MANDNWRTPPYIAAAARVALGGAIDLDPASSDRANEDVRAARYHHMLDDGLGQPWDCDRFFMNPPFSKPGPWFTKAADGWKSGRIGAGVVLIADRALCTVAGSTILAAASLMVIPGKRLRFLNTDGTVGASPSFGVLILAGGRNLDLSVAAEAFKCVGTVWVGDWRNAL